MGSFFLDSSRRSKADRVIAQTMAQATDERPAPVRDLRQSVFNKIGSIDIPGSIHAKPIVGDQWVSSNLCSCGLMVDFDNNLSR